MAVSLRHEEGFMALIMPARLLAEKLRGTLEGDGDLRVAGVSAIPGARATDLTFAENAQSYESAYASAAGVVLVQQCAPTSTKTLIRVKNSREAFVIAMGIFHPPKRHAAKIHPSAHIAPGVNREGVGIVNVGTWPVIVVGPQGHPGA